MRKFSIVLLLGALLMSVSCRDFADLYERIDQLEGKVGELEKLQLAQLSSTVQGLSTTVGQLEKKVYVESVTETADGYVIKFTDGKTATIKDGEDGEDGTTPTIGVKDEDGVLVWTVNGDVVKDAQGKSVPASVSVPEFKFENNKWWYRFGDKDQWKDCGEKTGPEPSIEETDAYIIINIGDQSVSIPKEVLAPAIEEITVNLVPRKNLYIPVGETVDLKDFFEVKPEGALKSMVEYTYKEGAYTIDKKGVLTATGNTVDIEESNNVPVTISSKNDPEIKATINIRICPAPNNEEIECTCTVPESERIYMFKEGIESFNALASLGGAGNYNPVNECLGGLMGAGGMANMYFTTQPFGGISLENGHLHFEYYVSSLEKLNPDAGQVELTSSGADQQERNWPTTFLKNAKVGWNEVDLALSESGETSVSQGPFNPDAIKWFRFVVPTSALHEESIMVKNVFVYEAAPSVQEVKVKNLKFFIPTGDKFDLKDWFDVAPQGASKDDVVYTYHKAAGTDVLENSPVAVDDKGILTSTGTGQVDVWVEAKDNPKVYGIIRVRTAPAPNNEVPASSVNPDKKTYLFANSYESWAAFTGTGGASNFNPNNNSIGGLIGTADNGLNIYFRTQPVNPGITLENGHLHFMYYVSDLSKINPGVGQVELTSSNNPDQKERGWNTNFLKEAKVGWNEVDLKFSESANTSTDGDCDLSAINWFRFYNQAVGEGQIPVQVKDVYIYAEAAPAKITIDGDLSDWANVKGSVNASEGATYLEFKMASDANNIYFYTKRVANSALWNAGGYLYYALDYDNNPATGTGDIWGNTPYECIFVIWPFAGTGDAPAFAEKPLGESMMKPSGSLANYNANGKADASGVELEFSIPRADFPTIPDSEITVYAWGNKSGENMKNFPLKIKL